MGPPAPLPPGWGPSLSQRPPASRPQTPAGGTASGLLSPKSHGWERPRANDGCRQRSQSPGERKRPAPERAARDGPPQSFLGSHGHMPSARWTSRGGRPRAHRMSPWSGHFWREQMQQVIAPRASRTTRLQTWAASHGQRGDTPQGLVLPGDPGTLHLDPRPPPAESPSHTPRRVGVPTA